MTTGMDNAVSAHKNAGYKKLIVAKLRVKTGSVTEGYRFLMGGIAANKKRPPDPDGLTTLLIGGLETIVFRQALPGRSQ